MSTTTSAEVDEKICKICDNQTGKYVCPRCNILYCGLDCYRSTEHSACSEQFYRSCVQEELEARGGEEGVEPRSMQQILQRMSELEEQKDDGVEEEGLIDSDDDSECAELAARLAGVDLNNADHVWDKLSTQEREEFQRILDSGDTNELLPAWEPWWMYRQQANLVVDLDATVDLRFLSDCPATIDLSPLSDLSKINPAVKHGVENTVMAYALVARHFLGDHQEMKDEAAAMLLQLSSSLGKGENFTDHDLAVAAVSLEATQGAGMTEESVMQAKDDLERIMQGPGIEGFPIVYVHSALSDCMKLLLPHTNKAEETTEKGAFSKRFCKDSQSTKKISKKQRTLAIKKLEFYIAWTRAQNLLML